MSLNHKNLLGLCVAGATLIASSAVMFAAKPAQAATFTVDGTAYDITTVTGSYNSLTTQLQATPWWGDQFLAISIAMEVWQGLGLPGGGIYGPFFASGSYNFKGQHFMNISSYDTSANGVVSLAGTLANDEVVYAVGSIVPAAVPEPLTILGSITAAGFGVAFKRKKNSTKEE